MIALLLLCISRLNSKQMDFYIGIIVIILFFLAYSIDLYRDIKHRQYSTAILIIVVEIAEIVAFIALCYTNFEDIDKTNIELLWERQRNIRNIGLIMLLLLSIKSILKNPKFDKNINL